jgi:enoyl-CoA hydratase/carnithine racemase
LEEPLVRVSDSGSVRTLALNRPQALNSFTGAMHGELRAALDAAAGDRSVRCVVVTGTGRGFCAGQDLTDPAVANRAARRPTSARRSSASTSRLPCASVRCPCRSWRR